jgi:hypothetical protein
MIIKVSPKYVPHEKNWTLDEFERRSAQFIIDNRLPRRTTTCRICLEPITPDQPRLLFKCKDADHRFTLKEGFVHARCEKGE